MNTAAWNQINDALTAEGVRPASILKILLVMPKHGGERTGATVYTQKEVVEGVLRGYPFSPALSARLANRVVASLWG